MNVEDLKEQIRTKGAELVHLVDEVLWLTIGTRTFQA